jgi:hypothetical protein
VGFNRRSEDVDGGHDGGYGPQRPFAPVVTVGR